MEKHGTVRIVGYSEGDGSVGISSCDFSIDTGLWRLDDNKEFLIKNVVRAIWELHDNGDIHYNFSDEIKDDDWDYGRRFTYKDCDIPLCNKCKIINNL